MTTYYLKDANGTQFPVQSTPIGAQGSASSICVTNATDALAEPGGAAITGAAMPTGGIGLTGWLSAIWKALTGTLSVSWSGQSVGVSSLPSLPAGSNAIGSVTVANLPATQAVSAAAWPLPSGAATSALQSSILSTLQGALEANVYVGGSAASAANAVPTYNGFAAPVAATWTSATAANAALAVGTTGMDSVVLTAIPTGSMSAGAVIFEVFDGAAWLPIKGARPESYVTDQSYALAGASSRAWQFSVAGFPQFRVRLSTAIAGTGSCLVTAIVSSAPCTPEITVGIDPGSTLPGFATTPTVSDAQSAPFAGLVAMTVGTTYAAQRSVGVLCSSAGNVVFQFSDSSTVALPVAVGWQSFPFACTQIVSAGTTATAAYYNMK